MPATEPAGPAGLSPVESTSRTDLVTAQLRAAIAGGRLSAGSQLVEASLVRELEVSRGTVREAIQRLVQEGLLKAEPHRGVFVPTLSDADIVDVYGARTVIEIAAALRLTQAPEVEVLGALREGYATMRAAVSAADAVALAEADLGFHATLVAGLGNRRLARAADTYAMELRLCIARLGERYALPLAAVEEHRDIVDAIESGDEPAVTRTVQAHMSGAVALLLTPVEP